MSRNSKSLSFVVFCIIFVSAVVLSVDGARLLFRDDFSFFNKNNWKHMITSWRGGENQFQYYTDNATNSYVDENGILHMVPTLTQERFPDQPNFLYEGVLDLTLEGCNYVGPEGFSSSCVRKPQKSGGEVVEIINPIQSVRISTNQTFALTYGKVVLRAKLSRGDWLWPSFFMMPRDNDYGDWPRSGEIDLVEIHANDNYVCNGEPTDNRRSKSTLHWGASVNQDKYEKTGWIKLAMGEDENFAAKFHTYEVLWNQTGIHYTIDDEYLGGVNPPPGGFWQLGGSPGENIWANGTFMAPFDRPFYLIMKVGAGGNYWPDGCTNINIVNGQEVEVPKPWVKSESVGQMKAFWENRDDWLKTWNRETEDTHMLVDYVEVWDLE